MDRSNSYDVRIDVVRFFAFFLVFFTHFVNQGGNAVSESTKAWWNHEFIQHIADFGGQGVPIFFALTGFLLGRLLIRESEEHGSISVSNFYLRRILEFGLCIFYSYSFALLPTHLRQELQL